MSYTLTIEEPAKAAWFERETAKMSPAELGVLIVALLSQQKLRKFVRKDDSRRRKSNERTAARAGTTGVEFLKLWGHMRLKDGELDLSRPKEPMREVDFS